MSEQLADRVSDQRADELKRWADVRVELAVIRTLIETKADIGLITDEINKLEDSLTEARSEEMLTFKQEIKKEIKTETHQAFEAAIDTAIKRYGRIVVVFMILLFAKEAGGMTFLKSWLGFQ